MSVIYRQQGLLLAAATAASLLAVFVIAPSALSQTPSPTSTFTPTPTPTVAPAIPSGTVSPPPTPSPFSNISSSELAAQRAKWNASHIDSYRYVLDFTCFCPVSPPTYRSTYVVTVREGATQSVADLAGQLISTDFPVVEGLTTIEGLFAEVERLAAGSYYLAEVNYDPTWGFPSMIESDGLGTSLTTSARW